MQCMHFLKIISRDGYALLLQRQVQLNFRYLTLILDKNPEMLGSFEFFMYFCRRRGNYPHNLK